VDPLLPSADKSQMTGVRREPRIAVMILVEASWQDPSGTVLTVPARMEDKSVSGACIRLRRQIGVGARLQIQCRRERFSGTVRFCRNVGMDYLAGIQRDPAMMAHTQPVAAAPAQVTNFESKLSREITAVLHTPAEPRQVPAAKVECVSISSAPPRAKPLMNAPPRPNEGESAPPTKASHEKKVDVERNSMRHKWLELPREQEKRNGMPSDSIGGNHSKLNHSPKVLSSEPISRPPFSERFPSGTAADGRCLPQRWHPELSQRIRHQQSCRDDPQRPHPGSA
jgi:hypothetical protein